MDHKQWYVRIFNIQKDEAKPVLLLMMFSFFAGLTLSFYFTASNAIFLKHFTSRMIPVSYMVSGVIVYTAWWILSRLDRKLSVPRQLIVKLLFVFITVTIISVGVWIYDSPELAFIMFTWFRILVYITMVAFWGLAGKIFNIRQGKRIFGLIGIGEVISIIIGYFSIPLLLHFFKTPHLLFLASGSLFLCLVVVSIIIRTFPDKLTAIRQPAADVAKGIPSEWKYWNLLKKPYFLQISLMALLPIFSYLFVIFLFLAQTKAEFANNPETIARFVGIFLGFVAILELILKLFSGRFLNKFGLKYSLLALPMILLFCISLAAIFGTLYGTTGMFFAFIALAWMLERSIRGAVYEPGFQLLYQPVPNDHRLTFQNQIEGIPKALGTIITGAVIVILSSIHAFNLVHFNWLFIAVLGFWLWIAFKMYEEYRNMLKKKLSELKHADHDDRQPMVALIRKTLTHADTSQFKKLFDLFDKVEPAGLAAVYEDTSRKFAGPVLESMLDPTGQNEGEDSSFENITELARSEDTQTRLRAARLLGTSGRYNTYKLLINLIKDPDPEVKKAAIISSGKIRRVELWPFIIENLAIPEYSHAAGIAVTITGEPILQEVDRHFEKVSGHKPVQLKILKIYESIGGEKAIKFLRDKIYHPNHEIRFQVLLSLSNLQYHASASEIRFIKQTIEDSVERMVWIMASLVDISGSQHAQQLQQALYAEMDEKKEQVFLLLSLLYDSKTIGHIRGHIESADTNAKIYALEISDMMISEEIKVLFFPVFEELSIHDRLSRFSLRFPQEKLSVFDRVEDIINTDYSKINGWTKACAIELLDQIHSQNSTKAMELLAASLVNPDPLQAELAGWILYNNYRNYYLDTVLLFKKKDTIRISGIIQKIKSREKNTDLLLFEKVKLLKNNELFAFSNEMQILNLILGIGDAAGSPLSDEHPVVQPQADDIIITSETGFTLTIPGNKLLELLSGDPAMTERYLRIFYRNNHS